MKVEKWKIKQAILGLLMIGVCAVVMLIAMNSPLPEDKDISPVLLFGPAGIYLIFTKHKFVD